MNQNSISREKIYLLSRFLTVILFFFVQQYGQFPRKCWKLLLTAPVRDLISFVSQLSPVYTLWFTKSYDTFVSLCTRCNSHIILLLTFLLFKYTKIICDTKWNRTVLYLKNVACDLKYVASISKNTGVHGATCYITLRHYVIIRLLTSFMHNVCIFSLCKVTQNFLASKFGILLTKYIL